MDKGMLEEYLNKLNTEQRQAATLGNESAVILAAAGSGKTTTLTTRISYLHIEKNVPLQHMLAVTFTNKAAREMRERLNKQGIRSRDLWIGTFHGICNKILQTHANEAGLKRGFSIMDTSEQETFFKRMLRANKYDPKDVAVSYILQQINGYKEVGWRADRVPENLQEKKLYQLYEEACINDNVVDFGELMLRCYEMFQKNPEIAEIYSDRFEHILVDEFQDTNELQYRWIKALASKHKCVFAVGDDDQCFVDGTQITMRNEEKNIKDVIIGEMVLSKAGKQSHHKRVVNKFQKKYRGEMSKLTFSNKTVLKATKSHAWFVFDNETPSDDKIVLTLCGDADNDCVQHTVEFYTKDEKSVALLKEKDYLVKKIDNVYLVRFSSPSFKVIQKFAEEMNGLLPHTEMVYKANFNGEKASQLSTGELKVGMVFLTKDGVKVTLDKKDDYVDNVDVYDIDVEDFHNFYANGILTHNSIYGFRGAKPENMNLLKKDFNAKTVKIEKNYRSEANILGLANGLIARNTNRQGKNLVATMPQKNKILTYQALNNEEEASFLAGEIKRLRRTGINYKDMAILYRTNSQSRAIEKALNSYNIPYIVFGGFRFFDRQEVKHAMAYLRLAYDHKDNLAFLRVVNTPARAIGPSTISKLETLAQEHKVSLFEAIDLMDTKSSKKFEGFINLVNHLKAQTKEKNLVEMVKTVIIDSGLENMYETDPKEGPERLDNLYELISAADVYITENPKSDITEFLAFSSLESDVNTKKRDENADVVKMMTVHASKGLEFEVVFITGIEQGMFPHANSLKDRDPAQVEEERRLMYVALTRAKHHLYLSFAEERRVNGVTERYPRSQFWKEFDQSLLTRIR